MTNEMKMETIMPKAKKPEAAEVMEALDSMTQSEQRDVLTFLRGVQFGRSLNKDTAQTAV